MFTLNDRLHNDTFHVCDLSCCRVLLMNDSTYPWLILVPMINGLEELHTIPAEHRAAVFNDIDRASQILESLTAPTTLNVAALGNVVRQLHIHVVARFDSDPAWPAPIWGKDAPKPYTDHHFLNRLQAAFETKTVTSTS